MNIKSVSINPVFCRSNSKTKSPIVSKLPLCFGQNNAEDTKKAVSRAYNKMLSISLKTYFEAKEPLLKKLHAESEKIFKNISKDTENKFKNKVETVFQARKTLNNAGITAESVANSGEIEINPEHKNIIENYDQAISKVMEYVSTEATLALIAESSNMAEPFDTIYEEYIQKYKPFKQIHSQAVLDWYKARKQNKESVPQWHMDLLEKTMHMN